MTTHGMSEREDGNLQQSSDEDWHRHVGHVGQEVIQEIIKIGENGMQPIDKRTETQRDRCVHSKGARNHYKEN